MKIWQKPLNIEHILYVAKVESSKQSYYTQHRQTDGLVYVLSGSVEYKDKTKSFIAKKGNIIYLSENSSYESNIIDDNYSFIVINFIFKKEKNEQFESELFVFNTPFELDNKFIKLNKLWAVDTIENKLKAKSIVYDIYSKLCAISIKDYLPNESKTKILEIGDSILENCYNSDLNIAKISEKYEISEVHFRRLFKKMYGLSPIKFVQNIRINKAKQLLLDENVSISNIALECGYDDAFYFSRIFKKVTGVTPSEYRKTSQQYYR